MKYRTELTEKPSEFLGVEYFVHVYEIKGGKLISTTRFTHGEIARFWSRIVRRAESYSVVDDRVSMVLG